MTTNSRAMEFVKTQFGLSLLSYITMLFSIILITILIAAFGTISPLDLIATALGIIYLFYAGAGKYVCFYFGIIYSLIYAIIAFQYKVYGEFILSIFFLPINFLGIISWKQHQIVSAQKMEIIRLSLKGWIIWGSITIIGSLLLGVALERWSAAFFATNSISVASQVVGFYLQSRRYLDCYVLYTIANVITLWIWGNITIIQGHTESLPIFVLFLMYLVAGIYYLWVWVKEYRSYSEPSTGHF